MSVGFFLNIIAMKLREINDFHVIAYNCIKIWGKHKLNCYLSLPFIGLQASSFLKSDVDCLIRFHISPLAGKILRFIPLKSSYALHYQWIRGWIVGGSRILSNYLLPLEGNIQNSLTASLHWESQWVFIVEHTVHLTCYVSSTNNNKYTWRQFDAQVNTIVYVLLNVVFRNF